MASITEDELRLLQHNEGLLRAAMEQKREAMDLLNRSEEIQNSVDRSVKLNFFLMACVALGCLLLGGMTALYSSTVRSASAQSQPTSHPTR